MSTNHPPTDPDAETIGMPSDDSGKGSIPEPAKVAQMGAPSEIGRYKILGTIGSGGMGFVYEAMQEAPRRRVALKVIKGGAASEMALRRFEFETQILAKLHHPNIAQIYEAGTWKSPDGEVPFFAMEYIPGRRGLIDYAEKRDLSLRDRLELFTKVCEAVHHGHQKGVIHRDLKPDNILVDTNGEPKIIDFGVARATDADLAVTTMQTTMGQLIGTLQYMSPEQCDADPDRIDTRSDVYALGVLLFQLLSGKLPYDLRRQAIHEAVRVIKETRPNSMSTTSTTLRGDVDTIAMKALEKDRNRRYQSAAELANDIGHFLNNEPIEARPLSLAYQLKLFTKKYKRTCLAVIALIFTIVLGIFGTTWGMLEAQHQKSIAIAERDIAQQRADEILSMSRTFSTDVYEGIKKVNAAIKVRKVVLDSVLVHLESLRSSVGDALEVRAQIAFVHGRIGQIFASTKGAHLGDPDTALNHTFNSLDIYGSLVEEGHPEYRKFVVLGHMRLAKIYHMTERHSNAIASLKDAQTLVEVLFNEDQDDFGVSRLYVQVHMTLADIWNEQGKFELAGKEYDRLLEFVQTAVKRWPNDLPIKRDETLILYRIAMMHVNNNALEQGLAMYRLTVPLFEELVNAEPTNGRAKRDLGFSHYFVAKTLLQMGNKDEAFIEMHKGLEIILARCVAFPNAADARDDLSAYINLLVNHRQDVGQNEEALEDCLNTLLTLQPVKERNPNNYAFENMYNQIQLLLHDLEESTAKKTDSSQ
ncbi:MAG: serine/threonine-protein kinase [Phycisphaerales bacterium]|jgi:serine/threonine protein kinase|nr:serine/threonine-protein kinase [Phycisphaerales bacterium]